MTRYDRGMSSAKHQYNVEFDKLISDQEHRRLPKTLSRAMTRPAYEHTSAEQKKLFRECQACGYYKQNELGKFECQYPWYNPDDYDRVLYEFLPCKEGT